MSTTVESCMKLPSFRAAKLVAGKKGKNLPVHSITVLEYADDISLISSELFLNGEICITAFASIKNDVEMQCAVLRKMKSIGVAAIVIYYIGIFLPSLDDRLVQTADEIDLPLFCMPFNRMDFRYGEMINDVMYAIYQSRHEGQNFVAEMLESIALLPENLRTIRTVLRMISDSLHCSFFILERDGTVCSEGQWPISCHWDCRPLVELMQKNLQELSVTKKIRLDQKEVAACCIPLGLKKNTSLRLLMIDDHGRLDNERVLQVADILTTFLNISDYNFQETTPDMLVRSIIDDDPLRMREIATQHNIDISQYNSMWVVREKGHSATHTTKQRILHYIASTKAFWGERKKRVLIDAYQNSVIVFFASADAEEFAADFPESYLHAVGNGAYPLCLFTFSDLLNTRDVRSVYQLYTQYCDALQLLYPIRNVYTLHDLRFVQKCKRTIELGGTELFNRLYAIHALRQLRDYETMLETLSVYLLDAGANLQNAAELLFIHRNTLKYRMAQIRSVYGTDIAKMPLANALYEAVAICRLTRQ